MNDNLIAFTIEIVLSIAISAFVLSVLQPVLKAMLKELCRRDTREAFWSTFTRLMIFIAPLIVVVFFTQNTNQYPSPLVDTVRATILHILLGQFIGLLIIGQVILNFSRKDDESDENKDINDEGLAYTSNGEMA